MVSNQIAILSEGKHFQILSRVRTHQKLERKTALATGGIAWDNSTVHSGHKSRNSPRSQIIPLWMSNPMTII